MGYSKKFCELLACWKENLVKEIVLFRLLHCIDLHVHFEGSGIV